MGSGFLLSGKLFFVKSTLYGLTSSPGTAILSSVWNATTSSKLFTSTFQIRPKYFTGRRSTRVDHFDDRVVVQCKDGSSYIGDIIIGADGVHSLVRQEMWRHANLAMPGFISDSQQNCEHAL